MYNARLIYSSFERAWRAICGTRFGIGCSWF